jgi:ankyrin repeat protein
VINNVPGALADNEGYVALLTAAHSDYDALATTIVVKGKIAVDEQGRTGNTALMFAAMRGNIKSVKSLLDIGANRYLENGDGDTALTLAMKGGYRDVAHMLRTYFV